jgi:hypothetical protein
MKLETMRHVRGLRALVLVIVAVLGIVTIVGSGGGGGSLGFPPCGSPCDNSGGGVPLPGVASITPVSITLQAGGSVTYTVTASGVGTPTYQWQRSSDGGASFVNIAGATASTYMLSGVTTTDNGAVFKVRVQPSNATPIIEARSHLAVSSMPGVAFQDGEFQLADWVVDSVLVPASPALAHTEERVATGGNPNAYRRMVQEMAQGSRFHVFHGAPTAIYNPATQGAILVIDYAEDCTVLHTSSGNYLLEASVLLEQGGRRYVTAATNSCFNAGWNTSLRLSSLAAADFILFDGPACTTGESCPDFSATALPLRLGFSRYVHNWIGASGSITHGIDNWSVTVWRH